MISQMPKASMPAKISKGYVEYWMALASFLINECLAVSRNREDRGERMKEWLQPARWTARYTSSSAEEALLVGLSEGEVALSRQKSQLSHRSSLSISNI